VVDHAHRNTEGMTTADMIEAISAQIENKGVFRP
jgi:hypothetical protein